MMKKCSWCTVDSGLLVLRIGVGAIFIMSGWMKVSDLSGTVGYFATIGFGAFWAYLVAFVELLGGVAVLLGIYSRLATTLLVIVMVVATFETRMSPQMMITPALLLFATIALTLAGPGKYSIKE